MKNIDSRHDFKRRIQKRKGQSCEVQSTKNKTIGKRKKNTVNSIQIQ